MTQRHKLIHAPEFNLGIALLPRRDCIFLAGSISNARNWQNTILDINTKIDGDWVTLRDTFHVFNPRRDDFDVKNSSMEREQIAWEYHCINNQCDHILFWFSSETLAPITLFELGSALHTHEHITIGCDPQYGRFNDVQHQVALRRPEVAAHICQDLETLARQACLKHRTFKK